MVVDKKKSLGLKKSWSVLGLVTRYSFTYFEPRPLLIIYLYLFLSAIYLRHYTLESVTVLGNIDSFISFCWVDAYFI